jgi:hypothetical protein
METPTSLLSSNILMPNAENRPIEVKVGCGISWASVPAQRSTGRCGLF